MTRSCKSCCPSTLAEPAQLLEDLRSRGLLVPGPDLVVVVTNDPEERVVGAAPLPLDWSLQDPTFTDELPAAVLRAGGCTRSRALPGKTAVLVRRRAGRTARLTHEMNGWLAWLNEVQETDCYAGSWMLVTDHGWRDLLSSRGPAGVEPRLALSMLRLV